MLQRFGYCRGEAYAESAIQLMRSWGQSRVRSLTLPCIVLHNLWELLYVLGQCRKKIGYKKEESIFGIRKGKRKQGKKEK